MQTERYLGILGGMSWASSQTYYRLINEQYALALGGQHSAPILLASLDFQPVVRAQSRSDWEGAGAILTESARQLERAGAGAFLIASNTMHLVAEQILAQVSLPFLNIFDAASDTIRSQGFQKVGLLGTRYTMAHDFFREQYRQRGLEIIVPDDQDMKRVNEIIFRELIRNEIHDPSKKYYLDVIRRLKAAGAEGVILGCTEIGMLLEGAESEIPLFDTTKLHAKMAVDWLLAGI